MFSSITKIITELKRFVPALRFLTSTIDNTRKVKLTFDIFSNILTFSNLALSYINNCTRLREQCVQNKGRYCHYEQILWIVLFLSCDNITNKRSQDVSMLYLYFFDLKKKIGIVRIYCTHRVYCSMYRLKKRPNSCALKKSRTQKNIFDDIFRDQWRPFFRSAIKIEITH